MIHLRALYFDPTTGQFLTVDPAVDSTLTPYSYVDDTPLNADDPSGLYPGEGYVHKVRRALGAIKQPIANYAGGVLNFVTLGHEKAIDTALGNGDKANRCSSAYSAGQLGSVRKFVCPGSSVLEDFLH